jgi:thiosulfate/3-mercaptopyruvate sulfurtransferase
MPSIPVHQRGYAHPELLAETEWLAEHMDDSVVRIVDARPPQQYAVGHIPGAVNLPGTNGIPRTVDGEMASPGEFSLIAGKLGNGGTIIVYDLPNQHMGLVAWAFLYYGHQDVRLLDGGFEKWSREGRPFTTQEVTYPTTTFDARPVEAIYCSFSHAKASYGRSETVFWDTRSLAEFHGAAEGHGKLPPRPGHMQGAAHLDWIELIDPEAKTFKPAVELRALLESTGITPDREVNTYCGGGRRGFRRSTQDAAGSHSPFGLRAFRALLKRTIKARLLVGRFMRSRRRLFHISEKVGRCLNDRSFGRPHRQPNWHVATSCLLVIVGGEIFGMANSRRTILV